MRDKKPQTYDLVKSMVHGKPSRKQSACQGMYDVFNWNPIDIAQQNKQQQNHNYNQAKKNQNICNHGKEVSKSCHQPIVQHIQFQNIQQNAANDEYMIGKHKKILKPHQIKQQLYMYEDVHLKRVLSEDNKIQNQLNQSNKKNKIKKLNENDEVQKQIIEKRKQKIKQFKRCTRDLPNSAFTTYYGKPAFQSYGRCNSSANLKTHNVMPHRGENNPKVKQTYQSALLKGRNLKIEDHLPRKPIEQPNIQNNVKQQSKLLHLPLQKPDLINHVRFSQPKMTTDRKQAVPSYQQLKKSFKKSVKPQSSRKQKSKRNGQKTSKSTVEYQDGLKFMNNRDHLINLIQAKKTRDSRVAYKVTECYPPKAQLQIERRRTESDHDYNDEQRPAGVAYDKSDRAEVVIYRRY